MQAFNDGLNSQTLQYQSFAFARRLQVTHLFPGTLKQIRAHQLDTRGFLARERCAVRSDDDGVEANVRCVKELSDRLQLLLATKPEAISVQWA